MNDTRISQVLDILEADGYQVRADGGKITPEGLSLIKYEFRVAYSPDRTFRKVDRLLSYLRLALSGFPQSGKWLDAGCGCCGTTLRLHKACKEGVVIGSDLQKYTLSALKIIKTLYGVTLTGVLNGFDLPFSSDTFDLVFMLDLVEHVPDLPQFLAEARRVVRPGGMLIVHFPPYYSAYGGHRKLPYLQYLPGQLLQAMINEDQFSQREYSLYKLTIGGFESTCAHTGWHIILKEMVPMLNFGLCANNRLLNLITHMSVIRDVLYPWLYVLEKPTNTNP